MEVVEKYKTGVYSVRDTICYQEQFYNTMEEAEEFKKTFSNPAYFVSVNAVTLFKIGERFFIAPTEVTRQFK